MDWVGLATAAANMYAKQQQGKAQGAAQQAGIQQQQDRDATSNYSVAQNAQMQAGQQDLDRQKFVQSSMGTNARDAMIGALLGGFQPRSKGGIVGGLLTPEFAASAKELNRQGLEKQFTPASFTGGAVLPQPGLTALPDTGGNTYANALAAVAQLVGAASPYLKKGGGNNGDYGGET